MSKEKVAASNGRGGSCCNNVVEKYKQAQMIP